MARLFQRRAPTPTLRGSCEGLIELRERLSDLRLVVALFATSLIGNEAERQLLEALLRGGSFRERHEAQAGSKR